MKSVSSILVRGEVVIPEVKKQVRSLARRAHDKLGYTVLSQVLHKPKVLARALLKLGIEPFSNRSISEYKQQKLKEAEKHLQRSGKHYKFRVAWSMTDITKYKKPIPEFVLQKALEIKDVVPYVSFKVDELSYQPMPDPFLVAELEQERYYIEVWDEPKFENDVIDGVVKAEAISNDGDDDASESEDEEEE
jgi:hypothetical protein